MVEVINILICIAGLGLSLALLFGGVEDRFFNRISYSLMGAIGMFGLTYYVSENSSLALGLAVTWFISIILSAGPSRFASNKR